MSSCPNCQYELTKGWKFCPSCGTKIDAIGIAPFELPHDYFVDKLEAKIEHQRGSALNDAERRLLRLPLFQAVEKNAHWFSMSDSRESQGYPATLKGLVDAYLQSGKLTRNELRDVGLTLKMLEG